MFVCVLNGCNISCPWYEYHNFSLLSNKLHHFQPFAGYSWCICMPTLVKISQRKRISFFFNPIFKNLLVSQFLLQFYRVFRRFLQRGPCVLQIFIGCGDPRADLQTYMTRRWIVEGHWILQYSIMWNICQSESYLNPDDIKWLLKEYYIITSP